MKTLITYDNPLMYKGYLIYHSDGYMSAKWPYKFVHKDYDGAPDAYDNRLGDAVTIEDAIDQIEEQINDL